MDRKSGRAENGLFGWAGKILDVDLSEGCFGIRETRPYGREWLGGRSLAAHLGWREIPPGSDAYDPENRIIITTGPLTGTLAPTAGRTVMTSISPRTYPRPWYTHSTLGGWFGSALKYAGYDAIVIRGRASAPVFLALDDDRVALRDARELWGLDAREAQLALKAREGNGSQALVIGPAGEHRVRFATVQHAEENASGHSGFGAVWGSKHLKAISVRGSGGVAVADPAALIEEVLRIGKANVTPCHGTLFSEEERNKKRPVCSQACTNNCQTNYYGRAADGRRVPGCCVGGRLWLGEGERFRKGEYSGGGLRVPPGVNYPPEEEATLHEMCNSLGMDLYLRLVMHPWLIRCTELGVHSIRGYPLDPANFDWFQGFLSQLARREGLGALMAEDLRRAMDELAGELPEELIQLGQALEFGFGFPAHREGRIWDGEPLPFWVISAMMYASESRDPTIGTHMSTLLLAEFQMRDRELARRHFRRLSARVWGDADALEPTFEGKAPVAIWSQHQHMILDTLPLCDFSFPQLLRPMTSEEEWRQAEDIGGDLDLDLRLLAAVTGARLSKEEMTRIAERAFTIERAMLARAGRSRLMEEQLAPHFALPCRSDGTFVDRPAFSRLLDEYYTVRGWDLNLGWPGPDLLSRLGLDHLGPELEQLRAMSKQIPCERKV